MFRLDYLSCFLTILGTVLVGRKSWTGLLISIVNSLIVCLIGFRTSQFGFIPANLVCICVYALSIRSWLKKTHTHRSTEPIIRVIQGNTEATDTPATGPEVRRLHLCVILAGRSFSGMASRLTSMSGNEQKTIFATRVSSSQRLRDWRPSLNLRLDRSRTEPATHVDTCKRTGGEEVVE